MEVATSSSYYASLLSFNPWPDLSCRKHLWAMASQDSITGTTTAKQVPATNCSNTANLPFMSTPNICNNSAFKTFSNKTTLSGKKNTYLNSRHSHSGWLCFSDETVGCPFFNNLCGIRHELFTFGSKHKVISQSIYQHNDNFFEKWWWNFGPVRNHS